MSRAQLRTRPPADVVPPRIGVRRGSLPSARIALGQLHDLGVRLEVSAHVGVLTADLDLELRARLAGDDLLGRSASTSMLRSSAAGGAPTRVCAPPVADRTRIRVGIGVAPRRMSSSSATVVGTF
jgi:hypothetical protein